MPKSGVKYYNHAVCFEMLSLFMAKVLPKGNCFTVVNAYLSLYALHCTVLTIHHTVYTYMYGCLLRRFASKPE